MMTGTKISLSTFLLAILLTPLTTTATEARITTSFSPDGGAVANVLTAIDSARKTIAVAA